jgi:hypothetical protein
MIKLNLHPTYGKTFSGMATLPGKVAVLFNAKHVYCINSVESCFDFIQPYMITLDYQYMCGLIFVQNVMFFWHYKCHLKKKKSKAQVCSSLSVLKITYFLGCDAV